MVLSAGEFIAGGVATVGGAVFAPPAVGTATVAADDVAAATATAAADEVVVNTVVLEIDGLANAGNALDKGGFTIAGRSLQKHGSRAGGVYPKATGNPATINVQGESTLRGILTNPNVTSVTRHHARFGDVLECKIPGGQGARFSADGKTFIGFIEP